MLKSKTCLRVTVGVLWTLTSAPMVDTWPPVQRIRLSWFGAPSKTTTYELCLEETHCDINSYYPLYSQLQFDVIRVAGNFQPESTNPFAAMWSLTMASLWSSIISPFDFHSWWYLGGVQTPRLLSSRRQCRIALRSVNSHQTIDCLSWSAISQVYKMAKKADGSLGDFSVAVTFPKVTAKFSQLKKFVAVRCIWLMSLGWA